MKLGRNVVKRLGVTIVIALSLCAGLAAPEKADAQTKIHSDLGGYTFRTGNSTYSYRYDTGATYHRIGNIATYRDNTGTTGYSQYGSTGRWDSFSNSRKGWTGSGFTPYRAPQWTTYRRNYTRGIAGRNGCWSSGYRVLPLVPSRSSSFNSLWGKSKFDSLLND